MPRKKSPEEFFRRGKEKGLENCAEGIDGSVVHKKANGQDVEKILPHD